MIYVNKLEKRVSFKTKTGYYLQLLMPETMKLPGITKLNITKLKITKDKNDKNVPHLEVILIHCNIVNNDFSARFKSLVHICS